MYQDGMGSRKLSLSNPTELFTVPSVVQRFVLVLRGSIFETNVSTFPCCRCTVIDLRFQTKINVWVGVRVLLTSLLH